VEEGDEVEGEWVSFDCVQACEFYLFIQIDNVHKIICAQLFKVYFIEYIVVTEI
jgi:hypothetical protein